MDGRQSPSHRQDGSVRRGGEGPDGSLHDAGILLESEDRAPQHEGRREDSLLVYRDVGVEAICRLHGDGMEAHDGVRHVCRVHRVHGDEDGKESRGPAGRE